MQKRKSDVKSKDYHRIYCDNKCFREYHASNKKKLTTCTECGQPKSYNSMRCQLCSEMAVGKKWLDSEIKELIILNPGAGYDYFIDSVFQSKYRAAFRGRLTSFLSDLKEIEGVDYIAWLQNPDAMRIVSQDKIPAGFERYAKGSRRSQTSSMRKRTRKRQGLAVRDGTNSIMIKIPREFRWGKYKPR